MTKLGEFASRYYCADHNYFFSHPPCPYCSPSVKIAPMTESARSKQVGGDHYASMAIQPTEFAHKNKLGPCETLCLRYICRHGRKNGREDIEKAIHVLELLLELEYPE